MLTATRICRWQPSAGKIDWETSFRCRSHRFPSTARQFIKRHLFERMPKRPLWSRRVEREVGHVVSTKDGRCLDLCYFRLHKVILLSVKPRVICHRMCKGEGEMSILRYHRGER